MGDKASEADGGGSVRAEPKKAGRPTNAERLMKEGERRQSTGSLTGSLTDLWKRKRDREIDEGGGERTSDEDGSGELDENMVFAKSRKIYRSPEGKGQEGEAGKQIGELKRMVEGIRKEMKEREEKMKAEIDKIRAEGREREAKWEIEKSALVKKIKELEKRVDEKEERGERLGVGISQDEGSGRAEEIDGEREGKRDGENKGWKDRIKEVEWTIERKEREERKNNILVRGLRIERGKEAETIEKLLADIGVEAEIKQARGVGGRGRGTVEMLVAKLGSFEQKRAVMENKRKLWGREERIEDDLTWKERKMKWKIREITVAEERKGKVVRVGYGKAWINGKRWRWDEGKETLVVADEIEQREGAGVEHGQDRGEKEEENQSAGEEEPAQGQWERAGRGRGGTRARGMRRGLNRGRGGGAEGRQEQD